MHCFNALEMSHLICEINIHPYPSIPGCNRLLEVAKAIQHQAEDPSWIPLEITT